MKHFHVCKHVSFLVESHVATVDRARVRTLIRMDTLVREEFVHALENFHAFTDGLARIVSFWLEEVRR